MGGLSFPVCLSLWDKTRQYPARQEVSVCLSFCLPLSLSLSLYKKMVRRIVCGAMSIAVLLLQGLCFCLVLPSFVFVLCLDVSYVWLDLCCWKKGVAPSTSFLPSTEGRCEDYLTQENCKPVDITNTLPRCSEREHSERSVRSKRRQSQDDLKTRARRQDHQNMIARQISRLS